MNAQRVRLGDLSVGFLHSLGEALQLYGQDPQPLLKAYGLDAERLAEPHARLSIPRYMRLGHAAIQLAGDPALGLEMGRLRKPSHLGLAGLTAAQAPTVRDAARALIRYEPCMPPTIAAARASTKTPPVPGCASIPSARTTPTTVSWSTPCSPAGSPS